MTVTKGYAVPDVERVHTRARELCQHIGNTPQIFPVLRGLMLYYMNRGKVQTAHQLGEQLFSLAQSQSDPAILMLAHFMMGVVLYTRGEPAAAHTHHTQVLMIGRSREYHELARRSGSDSRVAARFFLAWELWNLGFPDQAIQYSQEALRLAQEILYPFPLVMAQFKAAAAHQFRREALATHEKAEVAMALATEQGFSLWLAQGTVLHGWALAMQGQHEAGIAEIRQGVDATLATGDNAYAPYLLGLLAEAYGEGGYPEAGLSVLDEVASLMGTTESRWHEAELLRPARGEGVARYFVKNEEIPGETNR